MKIPRMTVFAFAALLNLAADAVRIDRMADGPRTRLSAG